MQTDPSPVVCILLFRQDVTTWMHNAAVLHTICPAPRGVALLARSPAGLNKAWHLGQDSSRNPYRRGSRRDVGDYKGIRSDECMITDFYRSKDLRSRSDIHVAANHRNAETATSNCYLLKDQAIYPDRGVGVNHYPVGMRDE
jgi:hypothetical protein